jgi:hypothetical protein
MRELSVREAHQNFSKVISAAEKGETPSSPKRNAGGTHLAAATGSDE